MNIPTNERAVAQIKINIKGRNVTMLEVSAWLRKQLDNLEKHPEKYNTKFITRLFIDPPGKVHRPVLTPRTEYRVEGGTV